MYVKLFSFTIKLLVSLLFSMAAQAQKNAKPGSNQCRADFGTMRSVVLCMQINHKKSSFIAFGENFCDYLNQGH